MSNLTYEEEIQERMNKRRKEEAEVRRKLNLLGLTWDAPETEIAVRIEEYREAARKIRRLVTRSSNSTPSIMRRSDGASLIYPGRTHSIAGDAETGKTWIALYMAKQFIDDTANTYPDDIQNIVGSDGPTVAYWDFDGDKETIWERAELVGLDDYKFFYEDFPDLTDISESLYVWESLDDEHIPITGLVIIDGVNAAMRAMGLRSSSNEDVAHWFNQVVLPLSRMGITVVLLDHLVKADNATGRYPIGGSHKLNALSGTQLIVEKAKGSKIMPGAVGQVEIRVTKDRSGKVRANGVDYREYDNSHRVALFTLDAEIPEEIEIRLDPPEERAHQSKANMTGADTKMLNYIKDHEGCTTKDLRDSVNSDYKSMIATRDRLVDQGKVKVVRAGNKRTHFAL